MSGKAVNKDDATRGVSSLSFQDFAWILLYRCPWSFIQDREANVVDLGRINHGSDDNSDSRVRLRSVAEVSESVCLG